MSLNAFNKSLAVLHEDDEVEDEAATGAADVVALA
jgi:hypothetical protein